MKPKKPFTFAERVGRLRKAGLGKKPHLVAGQPMAEDLPLPDKVALMLKQLRQWYHAPAKEDEMVFFVMYDIENNKVRTQVAKYLIEKGCERIQKSVYVANLPTTDYAAIAKDLAEVQEAYENEDSILLLPITTDQLAGMRVIGQDFDLSLTNGEEEGLEWV